MLLHGVHLSAKANSRSRLSQEHWNKRLPIVCMVTFWLLLHGLIFTGPYFSARIQAYLWTTGAVSIQDGAHSDIWQLATTTSQWGRMRGETYGQPIDAARPYCFRDQGVTGGS